MSLTFETRVCFILTKKSYRAVKAAPYGCVDLLRWWKFDMHLCYPAPFLIGEFPASGGPPCQGRRHKLIFLAPLVLGLDPQPRLRPLDSFVQWHIFQVRRQRWAEGSLHVESILTGDGSMAESHPAPRDSSRTGPVLASCVLIWSACGQWQYQLALQ